MKPLVQKLNQIILDLIFPPHCVSCKTADSWLCQTCFNKINFITNETAICDRCGTPTFDFSPNFCQQCAGHPLQHIDGIRAAAHFKDNPIRPAIHFLKYKNHRAIIMILARMLAEAYYRYMLKADIIVPVPLHPARLKERGYNQSELLAYQLSDLVGLPVDRQSLRRVRQTKAQVELDAVERRENVVNAFTCGEMLLSQNVLLIDDVCTTGSTLDSCAMALKAGGVSSVWGLTLARAG
jgi:ComF family protein